MGLFALEFFTFLQFSGQTPTSIHTLVGVALLCCQRWSRKQKQKKEHKNQDKPFHGKPSSYGYLDALTLFQLA